MMTEYALKFSPFFILFIWHILPLQYATFKYIVLNCKCYSMLNGLLPCWPCVLRLQIDEATELAFADYWHVSCGSRELGNQLGVHKRRGIVWVIKWWFTSHVGLCLLEIDGYLFSLASLYAFSLFVAEDCCCLETDLEMFGTRNINFWNLI